MKLSLRGTPRQVKAALDAMAIQADMLEVERRMLALSMRCQERAARGLGGAS